MSLLNIILIAFSLSMDAFAVSISNGLILKKDKINAALKFGLFFGLFQFIMPLIGFYAASLFQSQIEALDHWIAFVLLFTIGSKMIHETFKKDEDAKNDESVTSLKNLIMLAIATSIDALAVGVSFAFFDINIFASSAIIGLITFALSFFGVIIGEKIGYKFSKNAERIGGAILIIIGFKILIEHLFF